MEEEKESKYWDSLKGIPLPVVVLDNQWHQLFAGRKKPQKVKQLEKELNELLKKQGQNNVDMKEYKKLKSKLMEEIVELMGQSQANPANKKVAKKMEDNQRLIKEINEKLAEGEELMADLPRLIRDKNLELMVASMEACYRFLHKNGEDIYAIDEWITTVRQELNKNILIKQEREEKNLQIYTYMHHILGPAVMDIFDMKYLKAWKAPEEPGETKETVGEKGSEGQQKEGKPQKEGKTQKEEKRQKEGKEA